MEKKALEALGNIKKSELASVKGMVLPPMFSFNVMKLALMLHEPKTKPEELTWQRIRKQLLRRFDIFLRKCENIGMRDLEEEEAAAIESAFQETYSMFGEELEKKAELYGNFIYRICQWTLSMRALMHSSKFLKAED